MSRTGRSAFSPSTWPYGRPEIRILLVSSVVFSMAWILVGLLMTEVVEATALGRADADLALWFENRRTSALTTLARWASMPSDTIVVLVGMAALAVALPALLRRWREWAFLATALLLEVTVALTASTVVGRPRPPVEQLATPPTKSWPSGHVAAAVTLYVGLVLLLRWHSERRLVRGAAWGVAVVVPTIVATSRLYLGAHYLSDVVAGAALGLAVLTVTMMAFRRAEERTARRSRRSAPVMMRQSSSLTAATGVVASQRERW